MKKNESINVFWEALDEALFTQKSIAEVLQISEAKLERDRWLGDGIPYLKLGKTVRYRKKNVLAWLEQHGNPLLSTSQIVKEAEHD